MYPASLGFGREKHSSKKKRIFIKIGQWWWSLTSLRHVVTYINHLRNFTCASSCHFPGLIETSSVIQSIPTPATGNTPNFSYVWRFIIFFSLLFIFLLFNFLFGAIQALKTYLLSNPLFSLSLLFYPFLSDFCHTFCLIHCDELFLIWRWLYNFLPQETFFFSFPFLSV